MNMIIPAGVNDRSTMQIQGEGNFDKKRGKAGDVCIVLHVDEKAGIRRDGLNLYSKINIDYTEAILGTVIKVETVEGLKELQIPLGIQPGKTEVATHGGSRHQQTCSGRSSLYCQCSDSKDNQGYEMGTLASVEPVLQTRPLKRSASLWESIKGILGKRQSGEGFASPSVDRPPLSRGSFKPNPLYVASVFTVLVVTCICTVIGKTDNLTLLQQKDGSPRTRRTKKNNVDRNTNSCC